MKKFAMLMCVIACVIGIAECAWGSVSLSAFPDPVLRQELDYYDSGWTKYDSNGEPYTVGQNDGVLADLELENITKLQFYGWDNGLRSLNGVENLTALKTISIYDCGTLQEINVNGCPALEELSISYSNMKEFNVNGCPALTKISFYHNNLKEINISGCPRLTELKCSVNSHLTEINLDNCNALTEFYCISNIDWEDSQMKEVNVSNCGALTVINCDASNYRELNVSSCPKLAEIICDFNGLKELNLSGVPALSRLSCSGNYLSELDLSGCPALTWLNCPMNTEDLKTLNLSGHKKLTTLYCGAMLKELDVSNCTALAELSLFYDGNIIRDDDSTLGWNIYYMELTKLNASNCTAVKYLRCSDHHLEDLNLSGCTGLKELYCSGPLKELNIKGCSALERLTYREADQLKKLDVSGITSLISLDCFITEIQEIDVSGCTSLKKFDCRHNESLTKINVSGLSSLTYLDCGYSGLEELNVSGCNALETLQVNDTNLKKLDVSGLKSLKSLYCQPDHKSSQLLELNASGCTALMELFCGTDKLERLNVNGCTSLVHINNYDNWYVCAHFLTDFDARNCSSAEYAKINCAALTQLDLSGCKSLKELRCECPELMKLSVIGCSKLEYLDCSNARIEELSMKGCNSLQYLFCSRNNLKELDITGFSSLLMLDCMYNELEELDASGCKNLEYIDCGENHLLSLDVTGLTSLTELYCYKNELKEIDVSSNTALTYINCTYNRLMSLDVSKNKALNYVECRNNCLTELDLSHNLYLGYSQSDSLLSEQTRRELKQKKTTEGYEINMKDYVSHPENVDFMGMTYGFISYSKETGIAVFSEPVRVLRYSYQTNCPDNYSMEVKIISPLSLAALERSGFDSFGLVIAGMNDSGYFDSIGNKLTESAIREYSYSSHGKLGLAADGNSRLIIRAQTDKPGTVSFSFNEDIGAKLESLSRKELSPSDQLATTEHNYDVYQVSAVLVAPESFPEGRDFPSDTFSVHVKFIDKDGEIAEDDLELEIKAAPVILIPGMFDDSEVTFGIHKNSGVWRGFIMNKFDKEHIDTWDYETFKSPQETLGFDDNDLFKKLTAMFKKYGTEGIVCTKADIIAFGMGGLMAEKYLSEERKDSDDGNNWSVCSYKKGMVRRLVAVAVPHHGTPWADWSLKPALAIDSFIFDHVDNKLFYSVLTRIAQSALPTTWFYQSSAVREMITQNKRDYIFPSGVPIHAISGNVLDSIRLDLTADIIARLMKIKTAGKHSVNFRDMLSTGMHYAPIFLTKFFPKFAEKVTPYIAAASITYDVAGWIPKLIVIDFFGSEKHDMVVSRSSALGNLSGIREYSGRNYKHGSICRQNDVGEHIASILKGSCNINFQILGSKTAPSQVKSPQILTSSSLSESETSEGFAFIRALKLDVSPSVFSLSGNREQSVKFTVTANNPKKEDILCAIGNDYDCKIFLIPPSDNTGRKFELDIVFASSDIETMEAFCFSHNPNGVGTSIHVSNTVSIASLSDVGSKDIISLDFSGASAIYASVNSETHAGLYGIDSDGKYYDISSPLNGTQWTSDEIARVNDNGCVVGLQEGSTTLTATFRGLTASVNVEVSAALVEEEDTPPIILTETLSNAVTNHHYNLQLQASGTMPIIWTLSGKLPEGLMMSELGLISGTPNKAGKSTFTVTAQNDYGKTSQKFTLQVFDSVSITTASLKAGTIGKSYSATMKAKGTKTITWSAEGLPNGLSMNEKGRISGKPTVYGMFNVKVKAENGAGSVTKNLQLEIKAIVPKLSGSIKRATLNESYSSGLKVTGSTPITWSIEGNLPEGLTLDSSTGIISGTPTSYAKLGYKIILTAENHGGSKSKKITLKVNGKAPKITAKLPGATAGKNYSAELTAAGSEPITFTADLPEYLTLDGSTISGLVPDSVKSFKITVYASNQVKEKVKKNYTVKVSAKKSLPQNLNADNDTGITEINTGLKSEVTANVPVFSERDVYSHSVGVMIVAELGKISADKEGMYDFEIQLPDYIRKGSELVYIANSDNPSDDDDIAEFYDEAGGEISAVPENRRITISIWLNAGTVYNPVIAVKD